MLIVTLLNKIEKISSFVYSKVQLVLRNDELCLVAEIQPRKGSKGKCSICRKGCSTYDTSKSGRYFSYVSIWGFPAYFFYRPRRVECKKHGIHTEHIPWATGKEQMTNTYKIFLGLWAKRLSWAEVAEVFHTSWDTVYKCVKWLVDQGLTHRVLENIKSIGIDEIKVFLGHTYLTLVYQIDWHSKRLLWCGLGRTTDTLEEFFIYLGKKRCATIKYVCTDMWKPYLKVIRQMIPWALNILDRFHIMKKFTEAIDWIRREEFRLNPQSQNFLKNARWALLKNEENMTEKQVLKLNDLLKTELKSIKAYLLKKDFLRFWQCDDKNRARKFLKAWCKRTNRTKLYAMKKVSNMLEDKCELILNWFDTDPRLSSGIVEGFNNKAKLTIKKAYGFKCEEHLKYALYHTLGELPLPKLTHRFNC